MKSNMKSASRLEKAVRSPRLPFYMVLLVLVAVAVFCFVVKVVFG